MITGRILFTAAAMALSFPVLASAPTANDTPPPATPDQSAAQLIKNCDAHKFETVVHETVDGQPQQSKVKLCGKEGQSDADWIGTLKDAVAKVSANKGMDAAVRAQIVGALKTEIARLESPVPLLAGPSTTNNSVAEGFSLLPSISQPKAPDTASLPPPRRIASSAVPDDEYAVLPTIPTAPPAPVHVLGSAVGASMPLLPRPRMTLTCATPGQAVGPCTGFTRDTLLMVSAGEDIPAGTSLQFVRDGDPKADIDLAQLKKGKTLRFNVPSDVCLHTVGGRLELRIERSGQEVGSEGPYYLSC